MIPRRKNADNSRIMLFSRHEPVQKYHGKKRCHNKVKSLCIKGYKRAAKLAERCARHPIELIKQRYEKHKPAAVNTRRHICHIIYRKGFITHAVNNVY